MNVKDADALEGIRALGYRWELDEQAFQKNSSDKQEERREKYR
jgi:hypothetical protein